MKLRPLPRRSRFARISIPRYSLKTLVLGVATLAFLVAAASRGYHLLGTLGTVVFGTLSIAVAVLARRLVFDQKVTPARAVGLCCVTGPILWLFVFPETFGPNVESWVQDHRQNVTLWSNVTDVLNRDEAFRDLNCRVYSVQRSYNIFLRVYGTVESRRDVEALRKEIFDGAIDPEHVLWNISFRDGSPSISGYDSEFFEPVVQSILGADGRAGG